MRNVLLLAILALGSGPACTRGVLLYETTPVVVQANPPAPPAPAPVVVKEPIVVRDAIHFDTNRDTIKQESLAVLDDVAAQIKDHAELIKIRVEGHTDNVGKRDENISLSRRRAIAVREYLIKVGIDADRLLAEGNGPDNPIANNESEAGRARNRRVAFTVIDRTDALGTSQQIVSYGGGQ